MHLNFGVPSELLFNFFTYFLQHNNMLTMNFCISHSTHYEVGDEDTSLIRKSQNDKNRS